MATSIGVPAAPDTDISVTPDEAIALDRAHVFHSWSAQGALSPMHITGGSGSTVWDAQGKHYLDFSSQLVNVNIGHQHPAVLAGIHQQTDILTTIAPGYANLARSRAAKLITDRAPDGFSKVFFTNGGADANENAIRMAREFTGRPKVLSGYRSYHGNTGAAINATGDWRRLPNEYATGHVRFFTPYLLRTEFWATTEQEETQRALHHLERVIQSEGAASIAAILLETVPGTAGILTPPAGYLPGVREIADRYGIVLIFDEVMAGFGRTGNWFAFEEYGVVPDLITFAKGVNSGYIPAGGVIISDPIADFFSDRVFPGGLTYSGHPLAMAAIVATLETMAAEDIVENAASIGREILGPGLHRLAGKHPMIAQVRGLGVFWAAELTEPGTLTPTPPATMARIKNYCLDHGLIVFQADNRIHMVPPCVVTAHEVERALQILDAALSSVTASPLSSPEETS
ncbi:aspartate aminotransferase family protein [Jonesia quinghaiensis]|uniref:aspartate aminotransferase family protein n=1 Tax=Jonesia quinghaiensis TaxID=262806 RepID=UPI00040419C9|nr:aspartate aminotransferase family protein [Jonesia quinghaiensis]